MNASPTIVASQAGADSDLRDDVSVIAQLAFARANKGDRDAAGTRHLSLLPKETLELDLTDPAQRLFGGYELLELIGEGGMGVVYRARQIGLDREVAVKLLAAGPWASSEFVERFRREAQNAARMQHPNIVAIYEVGDAEDLQFFSMRLVRGDSMAAMLRRDGKLPAMRAAQLLRTIAEAVDYAHRLGVLHLDLKPANVLLDENGTPHVADFGLARRLDQGLAADNNEVSGTPSYMAPEQAIAGAQKITPATDIWGLGAVLYELVTGEPPFLASTPHGTLRLVVEGTVRSPRRLTPDLPLDLEAIILKCMSRDTAKRYASGRALVEDLSRFIEGREVSARPLNQAQRAMRWARREPRLASTGLLAVAALLIGLAATTKEWQRADANARESEQHAATSNERLWASRRDNALRLVRDGNGFDALPLLVTNIDEQEHAGRADPESTERRSIGMILSQGVTLIDRLIIADASPMTAALSPDGSLVAVALNDLSVRWYDTATMTERGRVDLSDQPTSDSLDHVPQLLRFVDNHRLRVTLEWYGYLPAPADNDTELIDLDHARVVAPPQEFTNFRHAVYSPNARYALLFNARHEVQQWQVEPWHPRSTLTVSGTDFTLPYLLLNDGSGGVLMHSSLDDVERFDQHHTDVSRKLALPPHETVTAWTLSGDGKSVALGDSDGQVYLVDLAANKTRQLPIPTGRDVTWLEFSEDDSWIAIARRDGAAYAFEAASGVPLHSGQLQHDFPLQHVAISTRYRLLVASGNGETAIWTLPERSPGGFPASRLIAGPTHPSKAGPYWTGVSFAAGLLATADFDGEVRLWRLPGSGVLAAKSAQLPTGSIAFDGAHVPDVEYDHLRVFPVSRSGTATPWVGLPQPVKFAQLVEGAKTMVAVAGSQLHVFDAATMRPRYIPAELPASPMRLVVDDAGTQATMTFGENQAGGFRERLIAFDLKSGKRLPGEASVEGPLRQFRLSDDGAMLVAVGRGEGATEVFDPATLQRIGVHPHDADKPVLQAAIASRSSLWLVTRSVDDTESDNAELILWHAANDAVLDRRKIRGIYPVGVAALDGRPLLAGKDGLVLDAGSAHALQGGRLALGEASQVFAFSHDHRLVAYAFGRDVYLYDSATMTQVSTPLHTNIGMVDMVLELAFSADDQSLLCRTATQQWFVWKVASDRRGTDALRDEAGLLTSDAAGPHVVRAVEATERQRLRRRDPGWRSEPEPRPRPAAARSIVGVPVPVRPAGLDPMLLDLTGFYTSAPESGYNINDSVMPGLHGTWIGTPRIDGVDYDIRGGMELRWGTGRMGSHQVVHVATAARGVAVPAVPIAAFHVLIFATSPVPVDDERVYATVRVHYRDGGEAVLPIRTNREIPGLNEHDSHTPIAWDQGNDLALIGEFHPRQVSNPRLPNPHPDRLIASLDIEAARQDWSAFMIFAITAEPVIASAQSRNTSAQEHDAQ